MNDEYDKWTLTPGAEARIRVELQAIDIAQQKFPRCELCGQRTRNLDRFGLCTKTSKPHQGWRTTPSFADEREH